MYSFGDIRISKGLPSGWLAVHTQVCPLFKKELCSALRAPLVIKILSIFKFCHTSHVAQWGECCTVELTGMWQPDLSHFGTGYLPLTGMFCCQWQQPHSSPDGIS